LDRRGGSVGAVSAAGAVGLAALVALLAVDGTAVGGLGAAGDRPHPGGRPLAVGFAAHLHHHLGAQGGVLLGAARSPEPAAWSADGSPDHPAPGDTHPRGTSVTIDAPPSAIWPWIVQVGYGRAGWYTHEWVERLLLAGK
jgi:hypothetical protein